MWQSCTKCLQMYEYILVQQYSVHCTSTYMLRSGSVLIGIRQSLEICWFGFGLSNSQRPGSDQPRWIVWTVECGVPNLKSFIQTFLGEYVCGQPCMPFGKKVSYRRIQSNLRGKLIHFTKNPIYVFSEMKLHGLVPNSYFYVSASDLYIRVQWFWFFHILRYNHPSLTP